MKKTNLAIYGLVTCIALSIMAMCFTFAWFDLYPSYSDLILTTGDYPLRVTAKSYLKKYTYDGSGNELTSLGTTMGTDFNMTSVQGVDDIIVNGDIDNTDSTNGTKHIEKDGTITVTFAPMSYNLFSDPNLLDPNASSSIDFERFCFAFVEFDLFKEYFDAYVKAEYRVNVTTTDAAASSLELPKLFKVRLLTDDLSASDKKNSQMLGNPNETVTPENQTFINSQMKTIQAYDKNKITTESIKPISTGYNQSLFGYDNQGNANTKNIVANPNHVTVNGVDTKCYAYAFAFGFYMDPGYLFEFLKSSKTTNFSVKDTFKFNFEIKFTASNEELING